MQKRINLTDVRPGEYIYRVGNRTIDATAKALETVQAGHLVWGPRGGQYRLTAAGAREYRILVTSKNRPLVKVSDMAYVERDEDAPAPTAEPLATTAAVPSAPRPPRTAPPLTWLQIKDRQAAENRRQWPNGCELCGEPADDEMGEFWQPEQENSVIAHAQCGIDAGLEIA